MRRFIPYRGDLAIARSRQELAAPAIFRFDGPRVGSLQFSSGLERAQDVECALADLASAGECGGVRTGVAAFAVV
jgi:hypothetical protein